MGIYEHGSYGCPKSSFDKMFVEGSAKSCMPFRCQSAKSQVLFLRNCAAYLQFLHLFQTENCAFHSALPQSSPRDLCAQSFSRNPLLCYSGDV